MIKMANDGFLLDDKMDKYSMNKVKLGLKESQSKPSITNKLSKKQAKLKLKEEKRLAKLKAMKLKASKIADKNKALRILEQSKQERANIRRKQTQRRVAGLKKAHRQATSKIISKVQSVSNNKNRVTGTVSRQTKKKRVSSSPFDPSKW